MRPKVFETKVGFANILSARLSGKGTFLTPSRVWHIAPLIARKQHCVRRFESSRILWFWTANALGPLQHCLTEASYSRGPCVLFVLDSTFQTASMQDWSSVSKLLHEPVTSPASHRFCNNIFCVAPQTRWMMLDLICWNDSSECSEIELQSSLPAIPAILAVQWRMRCKLQGELAREQPWQSVHSRMGHKRVTWITGLLLPIAASWIESS